MFGQEPPVLQLYSEQETMERGEGWIQLTADDEY